MGIKGVFCLSRRVLLGVWSIARDGCYCICHLLKHIDWKRCYVMKYSSILFFRKQNIAKVCKFCPSVVSLSCHEFRVRKCVLYFCVIWLVNHLYQYICSFIWGRDERLLLACDDKSTTYSSILSTSIFLHHFVDKGHTKSSLQTNKGRNWPAQEQGSLEQALKMQGK